MFADSNLIFWGVSPYGSVSNFATLVGATSAGTASAVINLTVAEDMGIGDGEAIPKLACYIGTAITTACSSMTFNLQIRGSTDSSNWTVYAETGALASASFTAGAKLFPIDLPHRPAGAALPQYYDLNLAIVAGNASTISAGSIWAGLVLQRDDNPVGQYRSGFTVV